MERLLSALHASHHLEMELGRLAAERARDLRIRRLGQRMARDLRIADRRLVDLARRRGYRMPPPAGRVDEPSRSLDRLRGLHGKEFDAAFVRALETRRGEELARLDAARAGITDPAVRRYVESAIPLLDQHRLLAASLRGSAAVPPL